MQLQALHLSEYSVYETQAAKGERELQAGNI